MTAALRAHHASLRRQNDRAVAVGLAMDSALKPVEDGLRIERQRKLAAAAAAAAATAAGAGTGGAAAAIGGGDGRKEDGGEAVVEGVVS